MPVIESFKLKRFAVSLLAALSLFAASVSACGCSHHQENTRADSSACHEHGAAAASRENSGNFPASSKTFVSEPICVCAPPAPKAFAKSDNLKVEKHREALSFVPPFNFVIVRPFVLPVGDFSKPFYLSDSFYNLSPGRAPPRL